MPTAVSDGALCRRWVESDIEFVVDAFRQAMFEWFHIPNLTQHQHGMNDSCEGCVAQRSCLRCSRRHFVHSAAKSEGVPIWIISLPRPEPTAIGTSIVRRYDPVASLEHRHGLDDALAQHSVQRFMHAFRCGAIRI
eukprot:4793626-Pyramimonas_sp.AAC.1